MIYKYRVTLDGIKGFYRVYKINSDNSLYTFHKQLRSDLEFAVDQPILFKAFNKSGNVIAKYALIDLGFGTVDITTMAAAFKAGAVRFVYFYDVTSRKSVNITFEGEEPGYVAYPTVIESKGPNPIEFENGYVAFEDLPEEHRHLPKDDDDPDLDEEDDDEDEEEDEEKDDEEEIIYDENETD